MNVILHMQVHVGNWGNLSLGLKALNKQSADICSVYKTRTKCVPGDAKHKDIGGVGKCMKQLCCSHDYGIRNVVCTRFLVELCLSVA